MGRNGLEEAMDIMDDNSDGENDHSDSGMEFDEIEVDSSQPEFKILSLEEVIKLMNDEIRETKDVIKLSSTAIRMLLNHFKWDKEKLMDAYYGCSSDMEQLFENAQIQFLNQTRESERVLSSPDQDCQICFTQRSPNIMARMDCGHQFCLYCWDDYLTSKIRDEGTSESIRCPEPECRVILDDRSVLGLVSDPSVKTKFEQRMLDSFVQCNRKLRWCPGAGCSKIIYKESSDVKPVKCTCRTELCFPCGQSWHSPIKCAVLRKWLKSCEDDSGTNQWLIVNTKNCPKCNASIEKNGGCVHMTCRNKSCSHHFCWVCLGNWGQHHSYECNRYDEGAERDRTSAKAALERLVHYQKRYAFHEQSLKFARDLYTKICEKIMSFQNKIELEWMEAQFLKDEIDTLCRCRQTLMYSYVFAHSLQTSSQSQIFEDNQSYLEKVTEELSNILEKETDNLKNFADFRQTVLDKANYCENRRLKLLEHVEDGNEKDWWTFRK